jgi:hypothetical protein
MSVSQAAFRAALLDPQAAVPDGLTDAEGRPAGKRFDVYRNNVVASLAAGLETGFPALRALIGAERFRGLAIAYARAHPPSSPLMMHLGAEMPAFLAAFAPLAPLPHLPDLARLELAIRESYHAADAAPVEPADLGALAPEELAETRLALAPALRLVRSDHPVVSLRRAALDGAPAPRAAAETALVTRPGYDPQVVALSPAGAAFVGALATGATLGAAAEAGAARDPDFTPAAPLSALLQGGAIVALSKDPVP